MDGAILRLRHIASGRPTVNAPLVPGGPTLLQIFLSGGDPQDSDHMAENGVG